MKSVQLDNVTHRDLRVITTRGAAWGDDQMSSPVFLTEFRSAQAYYPIVLQPSGEGDGFHPVALMGLRAGENLFLDARGWDAHYIPLAFERGPFMIGRGDNELMVHLDTGSPRIGHGEGTPVFLPHGGASEYLERINSVLLTIHQGVEALPAFNAALARHGLVESFVLDVEAADGSDNRLAGFFTIAEDKLAALEASALAELHAAGHLSAIYMMVASLAHFRDLIERYNRRLARAA
jgi:hypothetical protein